MKIIVIIRAMILLTSLTLVSPAIAEQLTINIVTAKGTFAKGIGVSLVPKVAVQSPPPESQIMDQVNTQFQPHVLMVQAGAKVSFPNSDSVKHHVYSFSKAKPFELKLYRDRKPDPLTFDSSGEVALGCNIHDWMIGYIYVVDTPYFGKSDMNGKATLKLPAGQYKLKLHSPQLQGNDIQFTQNISISGDQVFTVTLKNPLIETQADFEDSDEFDAY